MKYVLEVEINKEYNVDFDMLTQAFNKEWLEYLDGDDPEDLSPGEVTDFVYEIVAELGPDELDLYPSVFEDTLYGTVDFSVNGVV